MLKYQPLRPFDLPKRQKLSFFHNVIMNRIKVLEQYHEQDALLKLAAKSSSKGIGAQLHAQHDASQAHNRKMLVKP